MASTRPQYWCHCCNTFVRVRSPDSIICLNCNAGFVEEMNPHRRSNRHHLFDQFPARIENPEPEPGRRSRSNRRNRSHINPIIVMRGREGRGSYELFYDTGSSGLRRLPTSLSALLMGSGLDRIIDHLVQLDGNGIVISNPPASKDAVDLLPTIKINLGHLISDAHCAVCTEPFEVDSKALEMPCNHIYHSDCILPWLGIRNSCPVCRYELPPEISEMGQRDDDDYSMGLTIWRLPGGGFAVGRFNGSRGVDESELPVVYTEMDGGGLNAGGGGPRRLVWSTSENRTRGRGSVSRALDNFLTFLRRFRISSPRLNVEI